MTGWALFDTAVGTCGVAWRADDRLALVELPPAYPGRLSAAVGGAGPAVPPPVVQAGIDAMTAQLTGEPVECVVPLDLSGVSAFDRAVYEVARAIPYGETRTYGEVAALVGQPGAAQAVGQALGRNPLPIVVPCHRVLAAGGAIGGFSAGGGAATKRAMLEAEGAPGFQTLF